MNKFIKDMTKEEMIQLVNEMSDNDFKRFKKNLEKGYWTEIKKSLLEEFGDDE